MNIFLLAMIFLSSTYTLCMETPVDKKRKKKPAAEWFSQTLEYLRIVRLAPRIKNPTQKQYELDENATKRKHIANLFLDAYEESESEKFPVPSDTIETEFDYKVTPLSGINSRHGENICSNLVKEKNAPFNKRFKLIFPKGAKDTGPAYLYDFVEDMERVFSILASSRLDTDGRIILNLTTPYAWNKKLQKQQKQIRLIETSNGKIKNFSIDIARGQIADEEREKISEEVRRNMQFQADQKVTDELISELYIEAQDKVKKEWVDGQLEKMTKDELEKRGKEIGEKKYREKKIELRQKFTETYDKHYQNLLNQETTKINSAAEKRINDAKMKNQLLGVGTCALVIGGILGATKAFVWWKSRSAQV